jgi:hypothetical protein
MLRFSRWVLGVGLVGWLLAGPAGDGPGAAAAEPPAADQSKGTAAGRSPAQPAPAPRRGRLPRYFAQVATPEQRASLDQIQALYASRIDKLRAEIEALVAQRDTELRAALGPEQLEQLEQLELAARGRRQARAAAPSTQAPSTQNTDPKGPASSRASPSRGTGASNRQRP